MMMVVPAGNVEQFQELLKQFAKIQDKGSAGTTANGGEQQPPSVTSDQSSIQPGVAQESSCVAVATSSPPAVVSSPPFSEAMANATVISASNVTSDVLLSQAKINDAQNRSRSSLFCFEFESTLIRSRRLWYSVQKLFFIFFHLHVHHRAKWMKSNRGSKDK
jgi:hypothetical protein